MFEFMKASGKKETASGEKESKFEMELQEIEALSLQTQEHKRAIPVSEQGKFLKIGAHRVTGKELNATTAHFDESFIQTKNVQSKMLGHIIQLYQALDSLDAEHVAGILTALEAAETAAAWARINDENIGKIIRLLKQDEQVVAHAKRQDDRLTALERKLKIAYYVAGGATLVAITSLALCFLALF